MHVYIISSLNSEIMNVHVALVSCDVRVSQTLKNQSLICIVINNIRKKKTNVRVLTFKLY